MEKINAEILISYDDDYCRSLIFKIFDVSEQNVHLFRIFPAVIMMVKKEIREEETMNLIRAQRDQLFEYGPFIIRRQRPGEAWGPLAVIDQMTLKMDAHIPLHTHKDDEIFSYVWRGSAQYLTEDGEKVALNTKRAMVVSAGSGVRFAESAPFIETEMMQVYIRPTHSGGEPRVQTFNRAADAPANSWTLLAGPESSDAPMILRQDVLIFDLKIARGVEVDVPHVQGYSSWISVLDGIVQVGEARLLQGDAISEQGALPPVRGERDATLIAFLVRDAATAVMSGTVSGT